MMTKPTIIIKQEGYEIIPAGEPISKSGIQTLLQDIRPLWKGKNLIQRVERLLPVDPSSACQRLFNAAIHDLKEKIIVIGVDVAKEVAINSKLPSINSDDDILEYNVSKTIDLSYRIGILTRAEWRRIHRCYEIRRDLEHEDNEYEAVLEDCFYIFKSVIDIVLSQDPIELLKVTDAKEIIEVSTNISVSEDFLENFGKLPHLRQREITELLISYAYDEKKPDIVRQNSVELMRHLHPLTPNQVTIEISIIIDSRYCKKGIDIKTAKISTACGAMPYFKRSKLRDFYRNLKSQLDNLGSDWAKQGEVVSMIEDIGGITNCPQPLYKDLLLSLVLIYIGEPGYGYYRNSRPVFYSNSAAPIAYRLIEADSMRASNFLDDFREDEAVKELISNIYISRRFETLVDAVYE